METILVIDDEDAVREVFSIILQRGGYRVLGANSGDLALEMLRADGSGINGILLDVVMPGLNGLRLLHAICLLQPSIPVVLMSGADETSLPVELMSAAVGYSFVKKPCRQDELLRKMAEALNRTPAPA